MVQIAPVIGIGEREGGTGMGVELLRLLPPYPTGREVVVIWMLPTKA